MQRVRLRATPRAGYPHPLFEFIVDPPGGGETRLLDWNLANGSRPTALLEIEGDRAAIAARIESMPDVVAADLHSTGAGPVYCFLRADPDPDSPMGRLFDALTSEGLIVVKPVRYADGSVHATWVGEPAVLQAAIEALPDAVEVEIEAIGGMSGAGTSILDALSARQREALEAAIAVGYYEQPRAATHEDVAAELGCAPSTASEHLLKAESKLVRAAFDRAGAGPG